MRANGFKTFVVSGGGIEFMRPWTERVYGIPPEQVVGSSGKLKFEMRDGKPVLVKVPEVELIDDGPGKPAGIQSHVDKAWDEAKAKGWTVVSMKDDWATIFPLAK